MTRINTVHVLILQVYALRRLRAFGPFGAFSTLVYLCVWCLFCLVNVRTQASVNIASDTIAALRLLAIALASSTQECNIGVSKLSISKRRKLLRRVQCLRTTNVPFVFALGIEDSS